MTSRQDAPPERPVRRPRSHRRHRPTPRAATAGLALLGVAWTAALVAGLVPIKFRRFISASWEIGVFGRGVAVAAIAIMTVVPVLAGLLTRHRPGLAGLLIGGPILIIGIPALATVLYLLGSGTHTSPTGSPVLLAATLCPAGAVAMAVGWKLEARARRLAAPLRESTA